MKVAAVLALVAVCVHGYPMNVPATFEDLSELSKDFDQDTTTRKMILSDDFTTDQSTEADETSQLTTTDGYQETTEDNSDYVRGTVTGPAGETTMIDCFTNTVITDGATTEVDETSANTEMPTDIVHETKGMTEVATTDGQTTEVDETSANAAVPTDIHIETEGTTEVDTTTDLVTGTEETSATETTYIHSHETSESTYDWYYEGS